MTAITRLAPRDRERLIGCLNLLTSDQPGERDAAGLAACRFLRARGLSWSDVILSAAPARPADDGALPWRVVVARCMTAANLTDWEYRFLVAIKGRAAITQKQAAVLSAISAKVGAA